MPAPPPKFGKSRRTPNHHIWLLAGLGLIVCIAAAIWVWRTYATHQPVGQAATPNTTPAPVSATYSLADIPDNDAALISSALKSVTPELVTAPANTDITINTVADGAAFSLLRPSQPIRNFASSGQLLATTPSYYVHLNTAATQAQQSAYTEALQQHFTLAAAQWTYLALGDIIPARDVYTASKRNGYSYPYLKIADRTKQADLTVTNLETTVADGQNYGEGPGMMTFTAPDKALDALTTTGVDGINLANNHAMNGGALKVNEMLNNLAGRSIGHFGVSPTKSASQNWTTTVHGLKITHLGYDTVPGNIEPTTTTPGAHRIPLKPWGSLSAADITAIQADIRTAKQSADIVIPWFHWGTEYTHAANDEQRRLAQASVDAGADAVIGTHPHWTQGVEWYKDHLIAYSLGNLVFDQNWSEETKRSVALELTFNGKQVVGAQLLPAKIDNLVQPHFLATSDALYRQILTDIADHSWWQ